MAKKAVRSVNIEAGPSVQTVQGSAGHIENSRQASYLYFRSLTVDNLRCFGDQPQTLYLCTPDKKNWARWTIILGNNGTGKSTLLQLLDCVRTKDGPMDSLGGEFGTSIGFNELTRRIDSSSFREFVARTSVAKRDLFNESARARASYDFYVQNTDCVSTSVHNEKIEAWAAWGSVDSTTATILPAVEIKLTRFAYGAWRRLGKSTLSTEANGEKNVVSHLFDDGVDLINAEEWLQRLDYSRSKKSEIREQINQRLHLVLDTLLKILPDISEIEIAPPSKEHLNPRVLFRTPYGKVELRRLGFGYQSLVSWVVDFAARMFNAYPDSSNPLSEPAVCLVDEIDLHLHPSWQRKVMKYLSERFPKTQFIATAHSPLIVQAAPEIGANVVVLHREGDHVVISNNPIDVQGWRADQILSSELFDNQPLRSPDIQMAMDERTKLLSKQKLTAKDHKRLADLEGVVATLPIGSTPEERDVTAQLKAAAALLNRVTARKQ